VAESFARENREFVIDCHTDASRTIHVTRH
jgi:hypothetical protein